MKPGRPSHVYHAMVLTAAKLVLNVDAEAGNRIARAYAQPSLWGWLEARERKGGEWYEHAVLVTNWSERE